MTLMPAKTPNSFINIEGSRLQNGMPTSGAAFNISALTLKPGLGEAVFLSGFDGVSGAPRNNSQPVTPAMTMIPSVL